LFQQHPLEHYRAMGLGALLAFPAVAMYLTFPRLLDRYDPEPWWALAMVFVWGAVAACGFAATINSLVDGLVGGHEGDIVSAVLSAPFVEESFKGMALLGMFWFFRREFDGLIDGVIYATFVALGFAAVENVVYLARAYHQHQAQGLAQIFIVRELVSPWAHPLFTSMTGLGMGFARETRRPVVRLLAPVLGYLAAVALHMVWNGAAVLSQETHTPLVVLLLPLWFLFVLAFVGITFGLALRRGRIIRENLQDEVLLGNLSAWELDLVCSPFGRFRAGRMKNGEVAAEFVAAAARLGLSKWHAARAYEGRTATVSYEFIGPLRQRLQALRAQLQRG
jgi:RsiW-degrading membrane proteinase PrsW (M82 family)